MHSNIAGDNAIDGGLTLNDTALVPGTLTLSGLEHLHRPDDRRGRHPGPGAERFHRAEPDDCLGQRHDAGRHGRRPRTSTSGRPDPDRQRQFQRGRRDDRQQRLGHPRAGGPGLFRTLNIGGLTLNTGSMLNYDIGSGSQDVINVTNGGGLAVNGGGINLYGADGATPFSTPGTYTLLNYAGPISGAAANLSVLDPEPGRDLYLHRHRQRRGAQHRAFRSPGTAAAIRPSSGATRPIGAACRPPATAMRCVFSGSVGLSNTNDIANLNLIGLDLQQLGRGLQPQRQQHPAQRRRSSTTAAATQTIGLDIGLSGGNPTINAAAGNIVLNGVISDGGAGLGIVKTGPGISTLNGNNTYSGGTVVNQGTLQLGNNNAWAAGR